MAKRNPINDYLERWAEPEAAQTLQLFETVQAQKKTFQQSLVIPVFDESVDFIIQLSQREMIKNTLVIIIINQPENSKNDESLATNNVKNEILLNLLSQHSILSSAESIFRGKLNNLNFLAVDRFHAGLRIAKKHGVGLARKIGADIAASLFYHGVIKSPWIFNTDADATLPENYFQPHQLNNNVDRNFITTQVFNFQHTQEDSDTSRATQLYESALKYHQRGLAWAGSPYSFFTLGSTMAFTVESYCKVRGFPKRAAGEDFYLLNKLAKLAEPVASRLVFRDDITVRITPRVSARVPFGTGPAVEKIMQQRDHDYRYYAPQVYAELKALLNAVKEIESPQLLKATLQKRVSNNCYAAISTLKLDQFVQHANSQALRGSRLQQAFHIWFDGFLTLKFIHSLTENSYPKTALNTNLKNAPF